MKKAWLAAGIGILAAVVALGVAAPGAGAFERLCKPYEFCVWDTADMPIPYTVDLVSLAAYPIQPFQPATYEPFDVVEIIQQAFQAWANVREAYVRFRYAGPNVAFDPRNPRPLIRVYFTPDNAADRHLAVQNAKGAFVYVEIRIGTRGGPLTWSKYQFYYVMLHEIGHALGLDHPRERPRVGGPVMAGGFVPDGQWAQFDRDDVEGLHYLYPASRASSQQIRVSGPPEVEIWPASGAVSSQGQDFVVAITHSDGLDAIADARVLLNGQDVTPTVGWLFQLFGRTNPHGYVLSMPQRVLDYTGALHRVGLECWLQPMTCSFFPVRAVGSPFTITVIARDQAGQGARLERTYTITP